MQITDGPEVKSIFQNKPQSNISYSEWSLTQAQSTANNL